MNPIGRVARSLFPPLLFTGVAFVTLFPILAADTLPGDDNSLGFPLFSLVKGFALSGNLPLWNPYRFSGVTLMANPGNGLFYPLPALLLAFWTDVALLMKATLVLHLILVGYFTYIFLRELGASREGGLVGGLVFMLNGAVMTKYANGNGGLAWSFAWIPLTLYLLEKTIRKPDKTKVIWLSLVLAAQMLAGYLGSVYYAGILLYAPYLLVRGCGRRRELGIGGLAQVALVLVASTAIGLLLSGPLLTATMEIGKLSTRQSGLSYDISASNGLPLPNLITLVFPWFWGGMGGKNTYWGTGSFDLTQIYVGLLPLILTVVAIIGRRGWLRVVLLLAGVSAVLLALSESLPFYRFFYDVFPGASLFRHPFKFMFVFSFATATLAAMGYDDVLGHLRSFRPGKLWPGRAPLLLALILPLAYTGGGLVLRKLLLWSLASRFLRLANLDVSNYDFYVIGSIAFLAGLGTYLAAAGKLRLSAYTWLLIALIALDLGSYGAALAPVGLTRLNHESDPVVEFLKQDSEPFRIYSLNSQITGRDPFGYENRGMEQGIQSIDGYDPVVLQRYEEYANIASGRPPAQRDGTGVSVDFSFEKARLFDLLNVKYVLSFFPVGRPSLEPVSPEMVYGRPQQDEDVYVYLNREVSPRFLFFDRYEVISEPEALLRRLAEGNEPLSQTLFLEEGLAEGDRPLARGPGESDSVELVSYRSDEIRLKTKTAGRRLLFASEMYYPGWKARLDGVERNIYRADYLFRAVAVDGGEHEVTLTYEPESFKVGLLIACIGVAVVLTLGLSIVWGKRKR